ncbi:MAG: hypothetical protein AB7V50_06475 [Vampirovibrionia bacterium]
MTNRELSKLQVRSEVLAVIQQLSSLDETSRENQHKQIKRLKTIANTNYILECLIRELPKTTYDQRQVIAQLLLEFGTLETLDGPLWSLIKDPDITDEVKDIANSVLRNLGDPTDSDTYLSYLKNPQELIDKETERMLKVASLNPEAQIDFLDFLFSLPPVEQENLIDSLKNDYPGEYLTYIFIPAILVQPTDEITNILINSLGNTKSPRALTFLEELYDLTSNDIRKKIIKKNINLLKLAGAKPYNDNYKYKLDTIIYKCYASSIDGVGNQGIIVSRLKNNGDVSLLSVVINDIQGIIDCFGFNQITTADFERIVNKFQDNTHNKDLPPEYCKNRIKEAEQLSKILNLPISYEYTSWKTLADDINEFDNNLDNLLTELKDNNLLQSTDKLYDIQNFHCWFIEDDDHPEISNYFENILSYIIDKIENDNCSYEEVLEYYNSLIDNNIEQIFSSTWKKIYYNRLINEMYLFNNNDQKEYAQLAATAAWSLSNESSIKLNENKFIIKLMQKSTVEALLRFQYELSNNQKNSNILKSEEQYQILKDIINNLFVTWQVDFEKNTLS